MSPRNRFVPFVESKHHVIDPTHPCGALDDRVEDRLHISGRAADDPEHLRRCGLMLQGFAQLCVALLDLLEQPHVLDGDDCLRSERLKQSYLPATKWANLLSALMVCIDGNPLGYTRFPYPTLIRLPRDRDVAM